MSFIVFGPGVSDPITLNEAIGNKGVLRGPTRADSAMPVSMDEADLRNRGRQPRSRTEEGPPHQPAELDTYQAVQTQARQQRETGPVQLAHQIMSRPVYTLHSTATVRQLQDLFNHYHVGLMPIMGPTGQLEGIVSKWYLSRQIMPWTELARRPVSAIARSPVITAGTNTNIRELARVLLEQNIHGMPIVDEQHQVVGIVTRSDILRSLVNYAPLELWL